MLTFFDSVWLCECVSFLLTMSGHVSVFDSGDSGHVSVLASGDSGHVRVLASG